MRRKRLLGLLVGATGVGVAYTESTSDCSTWWSSLSAVRFCRAALSVLAVAIDYKWTLSRDTEDYVQLKSQVHLRSALRLRRMCCKNGGGYIKIGQHIGAMEYLLPAEYVQTFKMFHNDAPRTPLQQLERVIEEELHVPVDAFFSHIDKEPLGAASLAQCHRGVLKDGRVVAVKIQHPNVKKNGFTDMATVDFLVLCVMKLFPNFQFQWLAEEIRKNLPYELDFQNEAKNMEKCTSLFSNVNFVKIPKVHLATQRLLVMEFCEGGKVNNLEYIKKNNISGNEISLKVAEMYSRMIYDHGFIHCDPHPGNILVRKRDRGDVEIVLLDHGLYQQLTDDFRMTYCRLWRGLIDRDNEAIKQHCLALNAGDLYPLLACVVTARSWETIQSGISNVSRNDSENTMISLTAVNYFAEISQLLNKVPRQLLLILKTNDLLRSLDHTLQSSCHAHSFLTMSKHCIRAIGHDEEKWAESRVQRMMVKIRMRWNLFVIYLFDWWVWLVPSSSSLS